MVAGELASLELATTDSLTGLSNRRGFEVLSSHALAVCARNHLHASVVMIDMDGFKLINDEFGHDVGDQALVEFATLLLEGFRSSDIVARIGGDEFCALLTSAAEADAWRAVEQLRAVVDARNEVEGVNYPLEFSAGVAEYDANRHANVQDALHDADVNMYVQKRRSRERAKDKVSDSGRSVEVSGEKDK